MQARATSKAAGIPGVKHVIVTEVADLLPPLKRLLVNSVIKYVKKMVPPFHLPKAVKLNDVLAKGHGQAVNEVSPNGSDVAVLQYTGGTTGPAKGAMLSHRNMIFNVQQSRAWQLDIFEGVEQIVVVTALPLASVALPSLRRLRAARAAGAVAA